MILSHISKNIVYIFAVNQLFRLYENLCNKNSLQSVVGLWREEVFKVKSSLLVVLVDMLMCWMVFHIFAIYMNIRNNNYF